MLEITFDPGNIPSLEERFGSIEARRMIVQAFTELGIEMVRRLKRATPVGVRGALRASTNFNVVEFPNMVRLDINQPALSDPRYSMPVVYRPFVVRGRRPGKMPPIPALVEWVELKWGAAPGTAAHKAAGRLAYWISIVGTQGNPYPFETVLGASHLINLAARRIGQRITVTLTDLSIGIQTTRRNR